MRAITTLAAALALAAGCVSTGTYNKKIADLGKLRDADAAAAKAEQVADAKQLADVQKLYADLQSQLTDARKDLDWATTAKAALQKQLDEDTQLVTTMKQRLEKLGQNVDSLVRERGALNQAMADTNSRLEELRKQKAAADARAATFRALVAKLHSMIDAGQLKVVIRDGRMIIALPNDILFDSGKTDVKPAGRSALAAVAQVLASVPDRGFLVAGHTDDVPIRTPMFPSNWELSTRRAVEVVHLLVSRGMHPQVLAAAGYGEFDPVVANDSPDHRAQNRRIEIVLQPKLADLPSSDDPSARP